MVRLQLDERRWQKVKAALGGRRRGRPVFQRQIVDVEALGIELHLTPSVTCLASCLRQRRLRGQLPAARYQP